MDIISMFDDIEECNPDIMKITWFSSNTNHVSIKISSDEFCYLIKFYRNNKIQICTINNKRNVWSKHTYTECKSFIRNITSQAIVFIDSYYELGGVVNAKR